MALAPLCALDSSGVRRIPVVFLDAIRVAKVLFNSVAFHLSPSAVPFWHLSSSPPTASLDLFSAWLPAGSTNIAHIIHTTFSRHFAGHGCGRGERGCADKDEIFVQTAAKRVCAREREREGEERARQKGMQQTGNTNLFFTIARTARIGHFLFIAKLVGRHFHAAIAIRRTHSHCHPHTLAHNPRHPH